VALRILDSNFEDRQKNDFSAAQKALAKARALFLKYPYLKVEKVNLVRAIAGKPALPNEIPWAEELKVYESILGLLSPN